MHSYFNTVGSKEGWAPSTFVSSRSNRWKDGQVKQQKAEDFMDDEDLAEAEEARQVSTKDSYSALGSTEDEVSRRAPLMDLLRSSGETMGVKLLRKMGWRDGQGIGPRVWRKARLDVGNTKEGEEERHLFAPENTRMISFARKNDRRGLGLQVEGKLDRTSQKNGEASGEEEEVLPTKLKPKKKPAPPRSAIGIGVLNDTGSDDDDPYSTGPKISYNRVMGGDRKKKKSKNITTTNSNPLLHDRPVFVSKKLSKTNAGFRKCHDGRLPLEGFVLSIRTSVPQENKYPPPTIPPDWKSSRSASVLTPNPGSDPSKHQSSTDIAKSSTHTPSTRGSLLGESSLPGKSVFSFLKPEARAKIATLTKNPNLPAAGSEALDHPASQLQAITLTSLIPDLDPEIASTALGRGVAGFVPYADNPAKLARYRAFLSFRAQLDPQTPSPPPSKPPEMSKDEWAAELNEFAHAATIFKPMTGVMATRFTSSKNTPPSSSPTSKGEGKDKAASENDPKTAPEAKKKAADPAFEAAALSMFGPLTRSTAYFYPTRLLCKRFDVPVPGHVNSSNEGSSGAKEGKREEWTPSGSERARAGRGYGDVGEEAGRAGAGVTSGTGGGAGGRGFSSRFASSGFQTSEGKDELVGREEVEGVDKGKVEEEGGGGGGGLATADPPAPAAVDPERNEALEAERPGEEVFRAIFGSEDEDSD